MEELRSFSFVINPLRHRSLGEAKTISLSPEYLKVDLSLAS